MAESELSQYSRYTQARLDADNALRDMGFKGPDYDGYELLAHLCSKPRSGIGSFYSTFGEREYQVCRMIAGPHGYAYVKLLQIKLGLDTCPY